MIATGYLAKHIPKQRPDWLQAPNVIDIYSVSDCVNDTVAAYTPDSNHNRFWMFNSPSVIRSTALVQNVDIEGATLFFYEVYESEFDGEDWLPISSNASFETQVLIPPTKCLEGFDVVTFCDGPNSHSPLSCNSVAADIKTNKHCLLETLEEAISALEHKAFEECEPGPYRIYAVYSVSWPKDGDPQTLTPELTKETEGHK